MQYLVVVQMKQQFVDTPPSDLSEVLANEKAQGRALYGSGDLRQSWKIESDRPGVVCLYEAESPERLQALLDTYEMIKKGYTDVLSIKLKPDSAYVEID